MNKACPCTICKETDHHPRNCPELTKDLQPGFFKPTGGVQGGGDEDDEHLNGYGVSPLFTKLVEYNTRRYTYIQRTHNSILTNTNNRRIHRF